jgi:hypothetical protein
MNDLLAPILVVMNDESDAFWCFTKFMELMVMSYPTHILENKFLQRSKWHEKSTQTIGITN